MVAHVTSTVYAEKGCATWQHVVGVLPNGMACNGYLGGTLAVGLGCLLHYMAGAHRGNASVTEC